MPTWKVKTYDVWGNADDGYDVNDVFSHGTIELSENPTDAEIVSALIESGVLADTCKVSDVTIDGDDCYITLNASDDGFPLCHLDREEN